MAGLSQVEAAMRLRVTQAYLSMLESGRRQPSTAVVELAVEAYGASPLELPLPSVGAAGTDAVDFAAELGVLGYPGYSHQRRSERRNPAELLFRALAQPELEPRIVDALPWLAVRFADMEWAWVVQHAKLYDVQNRLGYVLGLAVEAAGRMHMPEAMAMLAASRAHMERSRLAREDTLCHENMTQAERKWLRLNRTELAQHWNLLTNLEVDHLAYAK